MSDNPFAPPPPPRPPDPSPASVPPPEEDRATPPGFAIPTTFRGIADLARTGGWRFALWHAVSALAVALLLTWSIHLTWGTALSWAAAELPESGRIQRGLMDGIPPSPRVLSASKFLGIVLDPPGLRNSGISSDILLSVEDRGIAIQSVLGWMWVPYPNDFSAPLDRLGVSGLVAAWTTPALLAATGLFTILLLVTWMLLGAVYAPAVALLARALRRQARFGVAWRLSTLALIAPGLLLGSAVVLYANHQLSVVGLVLAWPTHLAVGWLFIAGAIFRLPPALPPNPFALRADAPAGDEARGRTRLPGSSNPFRTP